jgi:squalene synthase HpnC
MTEAPATIPREVPSSGAVMARAGAENFPVASRLIPPRTREDLLAIYGFARLVDDAGDEAPGDRIELLNWLDAEVDAVYGGRPTHPLMRRLVHTVRAHGIPPEPFRALIQANRLDQTVTRYPTFDDLLGSCALSANPVGRLVLFVFRAATPERFALSDSICTGLQLTEHWQDVAEDLGRGRIYLPLEDLDRFECTEDDLRAGRATPAFVRLMAFEVRRARDHLLRGLPLARTLRGRPALAVAAFVGGGLAALEAIQRGGYDVLGARPRPSRPARAWAIVRATVAALAGGQP